MNKQLIRRAGALVLVLGLVLLALTSVAAVRAQDETAAPAAANVAGELVIYKPPKQNGNWVSPVNYAGGTIHFRAQIVSMPQAKQMRLQFCTPARRAAAPSRSPSARRRPGRSR